MCVFFLNKIICGKKYKVSCNQCDVSLLASVTIFTHLRITIVAELEILIIVSCLAYLQLFKHLIRLVSIKIIAIYDERIRITSVCHPTGIIWLWSYNFKQKDVDSSLRMQDFNLSLSKFLCCNYVGFKSQRSLSAAAWDNQFTKQMEDCLLANIHEFNTSSFKVITNCSNI